MKPCQLQTSALYCYIRQGLASDRQHVEARWCWAGVLSLLVAATWHAAPRCRWTTAGCHSCWWWCCSVQGLWLWPPQRQQYQWGACWDWYGRVPPPPPSGAAPVHLRHPAGAAPAPAQLPRPPQPCGPPPARRPAQQRRLNWLAAWRTARRSAPPARGGAKAGVAWLVSRATGVRQPGNPIRLVTQAHARPQVL